MTDEPLKGMVYYRGKDFLPVDEDDTLGVTIDVEAPGEFTEKTMHHQRICVYGRDEEQSRTLRDEILKSLRRDNQALIDAGNRLVEAFETLLPGLPHIVIQDYTLLDANHVWKQALKEFHNV
jgi:hypothetical protein